MYIKLLLILSLGAFTTFAQAADSSDCHSIMLDFISKSTKKENSEVLKNSWNTGAKKRFLGQVKDMGLSDENVKIMIESLNIRPEPVTPERVKAYMVYVLSLNDANQKNALRDLVQLDAREINSKHITKFASHEETIAKRIERKKLTTDKEKQRYQDLYYGCRSMTPNDINRNASRDFKRFNLSLNLGTLGASYAFYNMDKDINAEWFGKLGYDIGVTVMFSMVGGSIQTKVTDTQIVKSLKNYFVGRALGVTDILIYDPIFNHEQEKAEKRVEELKKDPAYKEKIEELLKLYKERHAYTRLKHEIIDRLKQLPHTISMGVKGNSVDENNIDWNNLTHEDLDRPEVQEVLVLAAMAQIYQEGKGEWVDTGDVGLDRYAFNTVFYAAQIPKSIAQNFITYRMLCMGQDNSKLSFTKAVLFNVTANFLVNQVLYGYREKAIHQ